MKKLSLILIPAVLGLNGCVRTFSGKVKKEYISLAGKKETYLISNPEDSVYVLSNHDKFDSGDNVKVLYGKNNSLISGIKVKKGEKEVNHNE